MPINAKRSRVLLNASHVSGHISGWSVAHQRSYGQTTSILDDGYRSIPGLLSGTLTLNGMFDASPGLYTGSVAASGVNNGALVTVLPEGFEVGKPALMSVTNVESIEVPASVNETVTISVNAIPNDGVDIGVFLYGTDGETEDGNGTSVDNGDASLNGGVGNLHITGYSGLTDIDVVIQHSDDDENWSDLITFSTATGISAQRVPVSGTVEQYVRALWTVSGTGLAAFAVSFARR